MRTNIPIAVRTLRRRNRWRQRDLAEQAGLSRNVISRIERGALAGMRVDALSRVVRALDASLAVEVRWQGADLDRLVDRAHAAVQEAVVGRLRAAGWLAYVEVSFNHYGDRGRCDVVGWQPATRTLLVLEVKSRLGDLQETLGTLHMKARLGDHLARQIGWAPPALVVPALVVAENRTMRRLLARHPSLFGGFSMRGRAAMAWVRTQHGAPSGLLWFENVLTDSPEVSATRRERVRAGRPAP